MDSGCFELSLSHRVFVFTRLANKGHSGNGLKVMVNVTTSNLVDDVSFMKYATVPAHVRLYLNLRYKLGIC